MLRFAAPLVGLLALAVPAAAQQAVTGATIGMSPSGSSKILGVQTAPGAGFAPIATVSPSAGTAVAAPSFLAGTTIANPTISNPTLSGGQQTVTPPAADNGTAIPNTLWVNQRIPALVPLPITSNVTKTMCLGNNPSTGLPCDFSDLIAFRNWVYTQWFVGNVTLTLQILDGTYTVSDQFYATDPKLAHVSILGNTVNPGNVVLNFNNGGNNLSLFGAYNGGQLGFVDGITANGTGGFCGNGTFAGIATTPGSACTSTGIYGPGGGSPTSGPYMWALNSYGACIASIGSGARIHAGGHVRCNKFYYGTIADHGGFNDLDPGFTANISGDVNIFSRHGGSTRAAGTFANYAGHIQINNAGSLGNNYQAEDTASMYADGSVGTGGLVGGAGTLNGGGAWYHGVTISGSGGPGFFSWEAGHAEVTGSTSTGNAIGLQIDGLGDIMMDGFKAYGNSGDGILADHGGWAHGNGTASYNNGGFGFNAKHGSSIAALGGRSPSVSAGGNANGGNSSGLTNRDFPTNNAGAACSTTDATTPCLPGSYMLVN